MGTQRTKCLYMRTHIIKCLYENIKYTVSVYENTKGTITCNFFQSSLMVTNVNYKLLVARHSESSSIVYNSSGSFRVFFAVAI